MKKLLVFILTFICIKSFSQSVVPLRGDTIRVYKQGGDAVLKVEGHLMLKDYRQGNSNDSVLTWDAVTKKVRMMDRAGFGSSATLQQYYVGVGDASNLLSGTANLTFSAGTLAINTPSPNTGSGIEVTAAGYIEQAAWISTIKSTAAYNASPNAGYLAQLKYNAAGDYGTMGGMALFKANAVDGDYASALYLYTRENGGLLTPAFGINDDQEILIGGAVGNDMGDIKLQVVPKTASEYGMIIRLQPAASASAFMIQSSGFAVLAEIDEDGLYYGPRMSLGNSSPSAKSILELTSTTQAFLPTRMTAAQRLAITSVPAALFTWDSDSARYMGYDGANWRGVAWTGEAGGGGSGTINSGTTGKPAYYVGATTLDDFAAVDYATSGTNMLLTTQNTTDVGLNIKGQGSQTANLQNWSSSAGTGDLGSMTAAGLFTAASDIRATAGDLIARSGTGSETVFLGRDKSVNTFPGIWFGGNAATATTDNYSFLYSSPATVLNGPGGSGYIHLRNNNDFNNGVLWASNLNLGVGFATGGAPSARVHIAAGTATAGKAPLKLTSGTHLATPEAGAIEFNGSHFYGTVGSTRYQLDQQGTLSKGLTLESPGSAEDFGMWQTQVAITVSSINAVVKGSSPSVTINIAFGSDITSLTNVFSSGTAITNTTTGQTVNSGFNDATIPAGSWIRLISTASSGTITQIEVTINYTED